MNPQTYVVDVDYAQFYKTGNRIGGDVFLSSRNAEKNRIVCTLSDGLGSGVKANVLANLTAHMAQKMSFSPMNAVRSAEIIMDTLPVCKERKISYSTFSIVQVLFRKDAISAKLIEYDNPGILLFDREELLPLQKKRNSLRRERAFKDEHIDAAGTKLKNGQRLIMFTDGVTQAGLGTGAYPLGWRMKYVTDYIRGVLKRNPEISSKSLAESIIRKARSLDGGVARDDITCAVISVRNPRDLIIATGPPITKEQDKRLVDRVMKFSGRKIVSGGTTSQIFSRIIGKEARVDLSTWSREIPPASTLEGVDLVTEGMLTLTQVAVELENRTDPNRLPQHAARKFMEMLRSSDRVTFVVGTKINEAHQDPNMPAEIGIRRTIIHRIRTALEEIYMKETSVEFM